MADRVTDSRFSGLHTDPRFIRQKRRAAQVTVDSRFAAAFDTRPANDVKVNKYGHKVAPTDSLDQLRRYYRLEGEEGVDLARGQTLLESSDEEDDDDDDADSDGSVVLGRVDDEPAPALANDDTQPTSRLAVVNMDWDRLRPVDLYKACSSLVSPTAPPLLARPSAIDDSGQWIKGPQATHGHRISTGNVVAVKIYKSQFGKQRLAQEDTQGPPRSIFNTTSTSHKSKPIAPRSDDEEEDVQFQDDEGHDYNEVALRQYQLDRLRYFYAIVTLSSPEAAKHCYDELQGTEFERTANIFDLSFVPEDMDFEENDLEAECTEDSIHYQPVDYVTDALRHSKVKLTWDEEDRNRVKTTRLNLSKMTTDEIEKIDFDPWIAPISSASEPESDHDVGVKTKRRERLRTLMGLSTNQNETSTKHEVDEEELQITFAPALSTSLDQEDDVPLPKPERHVQETTIEKYKRKERERKERKRSRRQLDRTNDVPSSHLDHSPINESDNDDDGVTQHFNMVDIIKSEKLSRASEKVLRQQTKRTKDSLKNSTGDEFEINVDDERFKSVLEDHTFAIDPSDPKYKKTKNMEKVLQKARLHRNKQPPPPSGVDPMNQLVASVKRRGDSNTSKSKRRRL